MNTRRVNLDLLNDPFFIGFDNVLTKLSHAGQSNASNYPPYNLVKTSEDTYLIELAVAGFSEEDFDIELHDGVLTIKAQVGSEDEKNYLHKGIATRSFVRKFTLADTIQVEGVSLRQGILTVELCNVIPEEKKPKKIPIGNRDTPELLTE